MLLTITDKQIEQIKQIETITRTEAIELLSRIINGSISNTFRWNKTSKSIMINDCRIELTTKKIKNGHVIIKELDLITDDDWQTIKIN